MNTDFSGLFSWHAGLNPWLVVLLSSIAGLLAFAVSNALYVLHLRHRRLTAKAPSGTGTRVRSMLKSAAAAVVLVALILAIPGPTLVDGKGWLSGDDLFVVSSRGGFIASYPNADRVVQKGEPILQLVRDAGPEEIAEAANRRALLAQDLEFARLEVLRVDPLLLAAQTSEKGQLDELLERRRSVEETQQSLQRGAQRDKLGDQTKLDEVERELQATRHQVDQTESSFKAAAASYEIASRPDASGVFPKDEVNRREERLAVLRSRRAELRERVRLLAAEERRLRALTSASRDTQTEHLTIRDTELEELDQEITVAHERVQAAWQAIEQDKVRAEHQRQYRVRQIELQIAEYDQLLHAHKSALDVRAPWDGLVGFREPSPASARLGNRPLLVLYKPGSISVRIHVSGAEAQLASSRGIGISLEAMIPEAASAAFSGKIRRGVHMAGDNGELQIIGDPPEAAIREMATGSSVPAHVVIKRLNPLVASSIGWIWWLIAAAVAGGGASEVRRWWVRRRASRVKGAGSETARPRGSRLDWGGNPDEFLEYVVGVGIVPRKLRQAVSRIKDVDDRRLRREPASITATSKAQTS